MSGSDGASAGAQSGDSAATPDLRIDGGTTATTGRPVHISEIREAIEEVRSEGRKAVAIEAGVEAALVLLAVNLALSAFEFGLLPEFLALPSPVARAVGFAALPTATVVALLVAAAAFAVEVAVRARGPLVERYERANPEVAEALRTARDAAADDERTTMAARLYDDVLATLRGTSSDDLVDLRRIAAAVILVVALALGSIQAAVVGVSVDVGEVVRDVEQNVDGSAGGGAGGSGGGAGAAGATDATGDGSPYTGLQQPEDVLGDPEDVTAGSENLTAVLGGDGGGAGDGSEPRSFDRSGFAGDDVEVEAQQTGFLAEQGLEDADIIREYNLRIRGGTGGDGGNQTAIGATNPVRANGVTTDP